MPRQRIYSVPEDNKRAACTRILQEFALNDEKLNLISNRMLEKMKVGLNKNTHKDAEVKMIPSFITEIPDGTEEGRFLVLDMGGTDCRILLVTLTKGGKPQIDSQMHRMHQDILDNGTAETLFDHIVECMGDFLGRLDLYDISLPLGFTFSFPCEQTSLDKATLLMWKKGFSVSGVEGKDVVQLLRNAIDKQNDFKVTSITLVNDTVGTMMSCGFDHKQCGAGAIVDMGSNACYMEKCKNIDLVDTNEGEMCINMEWGTFGDNSNDLEDIRNRFDILADENSKDKGKDLFEKMVSGMYMGELVRLVLCQLTKDKIMFDGTGSETLFTPFTFQTNYVSKVQRLATHGMNALQDILAELDLGAMKIDCEIIQSVCEAVSKRSAHLCAAGIATIARKMKAENCPNKDLELTVGVDGFVYKKHPMFAKLLNVKANHLVAKEGIKIHFESAFDGSGKGSAFAAAVVQRLEKEKCGVKS